MTLAPLVVALLVRLQAPAPVLFVAQNVSLDLQQNRVYAQVRVRF